MNNQPVYVTNEIGQSNIVLVCEHASHIIPPEYEHLGLKESDRKSHAAWDIGANEVATTLSYLIDAPLVRGGLSRLLYDCNRPPDSPSAIVAKSELIDIPGNATIDDAERQNRIRTIHDAFHRELNTIIDRQASINPNEIILITIHSFTPVYLGEERDVDIGLLHDDDASIAESLLPVIQQQTPLKIRLNEPYSKADGVTYTLNRHGTQRGIKNVMIEINNSLVNDTYSATEMGAFLAKPIGDLVEYSAHNQKQVQ